MTQRRLTIAVFAAMLLSLQHRLWLSDDGVIGNRQQQARLADLQAMVAKQRSRNATRAAEVADLKAGGPAIEAYARNTLGMVRPGETFYLVVSAR